MPTRQFIEGTTTPVGTITPSALAVGSLSGTAYWGEMSTIPAGIDNNGNAYGNLGETLGTLTPPFVSWFVNMYVGFFINDTIAVRMGSPLTAYPANYPAGYEDITGGSLTPHVMQAGTMVNIQTVGGNGTLLGTAQSSMSGSIVPMVCDTSGNINLVMDGTPGWVNDTGVVVGTATSGLASRWDAPTYGGATTLNNGIAGPVNNRMEIVSGNHHWYNGHLSNLNDLVPDGSGWNAIAVSTFNAAINDSGAIVGTASLTTTAGTTTHGVMLVPFKLVNLADPYQGSTVIGTPSHNDQDTTISLSSTAGSTDINNVAWIAAGDASTSNNPRMPKLQATVAAPGGTMVWWKLSVIFHSQMNPSQPYRDFDTGASLTGSQITQLTNTSETGTIGYSDNIAVPLPSGSADSGVVGGWVPIAAGTPWNIYSDPDWTAAVGRGFFGGDAILSFKITNSDGTTTILPEQDFYFRIAGENPVAATCESYINTTYDGPTPNWTGLSYTPGRTPPTVPGYWFAYAMAKEETDGDGGRTYYNNFMDNGGQLSNKTHPWPGHEGRPDWNNDGTTADPVNGTGGYGLFQLTFDSTDSAFIMPRDWIWNWQTNVQQVLPILKQKLGYTQGYLNYIHTNNASFTDPSSLTTIASATSFNFWESSVITLNNGASFTVGPPGHKRAGAWRFTAASGSTPASWTYVPNGDPGYLYEVARKGVENHP